MRYLNSRFTYLLTYLTQQQFTVKVKVKVDDLFTGQPHHRDAQVRHAFSRDHAVLPATDAFIHEWNEP